MVKKPKENEKNHNSLMWHCVI